MFNLMTVVDFPRNLNIAGMLCLSAILAYASEIVLLRAFRGEVGPCACYGMS